MPATLRAVCADITTLAVDAIVNAANSPPCSQAAGFAGRSITRPGRNWRRSIVRSVAVDPCRETDEGV